MNTMLLGTFFQSIVKMIIHIMYYFLHFIEIVTETKWSYKLLTNGHPYKSRPAN